MTNRRAITTILALSSLGLVAGCLDESEVSVDTETQEVIVGCPKWGCGENSPKIKTWDFWELDEGGQPNTTGVRLIDMKKGNNTYSVDVVGSRLYGRSRVLPTLQGTALIGAYLEVMTPDGVYQIQIKNVSNNTQYWVGPATTIETYELLYIKPFTMTHPEPVCANPPSRQDPSGNVWPQVLEAILFTGDRYDEPSKRVSAASYADAGTWFNIGCAGSALAKLHLNRHTTASSLTSPVPYVTTREQRQALLKMYVSDLCGTGHAFTKQGTPLHFASLKGWMSLVGNEPKHEAYWNEDGALCLEPHRLWDDPPPAADVGQSRPDLKPCNTLPGFPNPWAAGAYLDTAIPVP